MKRVTQAELRRLRVAQALAWKATRAWLGLRRHIAQKLEDGVPLEPGELTPHPDIGQQVPTEAEVLAGEPVDPTETANAPANAPEGQG